MCRNGVLQLFGTSKKKWDQVYQIFTHGGDIIPGGVRPHQICQTRMEATITWLSEFFQVVGDYHLDGSIHLPVVITWTDLHHFYEEEVQATAVEPYSYRVFRFVIVNRFPKVQLHI